MARLRVFRVVAMLAILGCCQLGLASDEYLDSDGSAGTLILVGGGEVPHEVPQRISSVVGDDGNVIILSDAATRPVKAAESATKWLNEHGIQSVRSIGEISAPEQRAEFLDGIDDAKAVWICGGQQSRLVAAWEGTDLEKRLQRLLQRGGVIAGTSAGAAVMSQVMIASGKDTPEMSRGWDLMPDAIVDQHFTQRMRIGRLQKAVAQHPGRVGMGIDEDTAVVLTGRQMEIVGPGCVTIVMPGCAYRAEEISVLKEGERADLTQLRRAARQRATGCDPGQSLTGTPAVESGALVIVGGGAMTKEIVDRFVELAGGSTAKIVVLPTAVPREATDLEVPRFLKQAEVESVIVLTQRGPTEVESEDFTQALEQATGLWFGGGRQWHFVDAYEYTRAVELFLAVLKRGGVIGGSSAGATIQGEFLVRGHPLGNTVMMAEGYERGFGFLPGTAIDQHFSQRQRQPDLLRVAHRHRGLLGLGIDEGTAVVVKGLNAEVIGQHAAHFVKVDLQQEIPDAEQLPTTVDEASRFYTIVPSGESIDLRRFATQVTR
jgi:cyanophycinase